MLVQECEKKAGKCWAHDPCQTPANKRSPAPVLAAAHTHHKLTKLMKLGENSLSSELLSWGGSPFTTCVNWSNTLFHLG